MQEVNPWALSFKKNTARVRWTCQVKVEIKTCVDVKLSKLG